MKRTIAALLVLACVLSCSFAAAAAATDGSINTLPEIKRTTDYKGNQAFIAENPISPELSKALDDFSWSTAKALMSGEKGNSMYSPLSLYIPLSLAATGTGGQTYSELASVMGMGQDVAKFSEDMRKLYNRSYLDTKKSTLKIANSLWFKDGLKFKKSFMDNASSNYYSTIHKVDFTQKSAGQQMSDWVAKNTNNMLKPTLKPDTDTALAIMNTIYYKDNWGTEFNKNFTRQQEFTLTNGSAVTCDFMSNRYDFGSYFKTKQFSATSMHLTAGGKMYVALPDKGVSIDSILSNKTAMQSIINNASYEKAIVNFKMPKFSFSTSYKNIVAKLQTLGVKQAFEEGADFSKTSSTPMHISDILQDTKISVHEAGLEAAAFTVIYEVEDSAPDVSMLRTVDLTLDRPFLFIITSDFGAPLFIGVCNNPLAE